MGCEVRKIPAAGEIFFLTSAFIELDLSGKQDLSGRWKLVVISQGGIHASRSEPLHRMNEQKDEEDCRVKRTQKR
jgi:hypothetical protein